MSNPPDRVRKTYSVEEQAARRRRFYENLDEQLVNNGIVPLGELFDAHVIEFRRLAVMARAEQARVIRLDRASLARTLPDPGTGPTPERLAKSGGAALEVGAADSVDLETGEVQTFTRYRMLDESPLMALLELGRKNIKKGITATQYEAGSRYFEAAYLAGVTASGVIDPAAVRVDGGQHKGIADRVLEATQRYAKALKSLSARDAAVLNHVVLMEKDLQSWVEVARFPQARERRAITLDRLCEALDRLVDHYGLASGKHQRGKMRAAHTADFRPVIPETEEA